MTDQTIRSWAERLALVPHIERAISFNEGRLASVWEVPVVWNHALKSSAGRAGRTTTDRRLHVELHPRLAREHLASQLVQTFLHEVAHILQRLEHGHSGLGLGHGQGWWEAMIRLGERPWESRYHEISGELREFRLAARAGRQVSDKSLEDLGI